MNVYVFRSMSADFRSLPGGSNHKSINGQGGSGNLQMFGGKRIHSFTHTLLHKNQKKYYLLLNKKVDKFQLCLKTATSLFPFKLRDIPH
jgi:hypothetical protein